MNTGSGFLWVRHLCNDEEANKNDKTNVGDRYLAIGFTTSKKRTMKKWTKSKTISRKSALEM